VLEFKITEASSWIEDLLEFKIIEASTKGWGTDSSVLANFTFPLEFKTIEGSSIGSSTIADT